MSDTDIQMIQIHYYNAPTLTIYAADIKKMQDAMLAIEMMHQAKEIAQRLARLSS